MPLACQTWSVPKPSANDPLRRALDGLHDGVPVHLSFGEGDEYMELRLGKREERA